MDPKHDIQRAADLIRNARHAVALTGAGISTPSGIPDFRSPSSGLWTWVDPMAVASIWAFRARPEAFYEWVRPLARQMRDARPNPAHRALAQMESDGRLQAVITQNIDDLHQKAGSKRVLEVHGHLREATCLRCYTVIPAQAMLDRFIADGQVPQCSCGGILKPNVIMFGEMLPVDILLEAERQARKCDVMLVAGSSLEVTPASDLPFMARQHGAQLIIVNYQPTPADGEASVVIHDDVAQILPRMASLVRRGRITMLR